MWFEYKNIDFNYDESKINEDDIKDFFNNIIKIAQKVNIFEIDIEEKDFSMIYIKKRGKPNEWDLETIDFVKQLQNCQYNVLYADEDYGEDLDVLLLYEPINIINALFKSSI
jgi:hypothetical protein